MIEKVAKKISYRMVANHTIIEEDEEIYTYGLHQGIIILISWIVILGIGIFMNMFLQSIFILLFFFPIRIYAGGFHADSLYICYIFSTLMQVGALCILKYIPFSMWMNICVLLVCSFLILRFSPVEAHNKPLDHNEVKKYRRISIRNFGIELLLWILFSILKFNKLADCIIMSLLMISILLITGVVFKKKKSIEFY